ncbi:DNA cytosine methyltransferase [Luteimonas sp. MC1572]|uniref:DNA cytosine methyltransferase n=1 Tax=Luteimonas sp. MC1572 TaxID=2799325 RepID=UPI0018F0884A|nr:DNA cytosine methyltransferase [Luteimonas sp. MC1572]MBJ6980920.1 DNA cytosine methyltransferase [Luteimonas sp. MC1572]QQO02276.1 DNA cytosine methyltransferase [Luteimonas sp. MC1572]
MSHGFERRDSARHAKGDPLGEHPVVGMVDAKFVDLFAGCGGISLGLCQAGWSGRFAVERAEDAFATFAANFLGGDARYQFDWPEWLGKSAHSIEDVLDKCEAMIASLCGDVSLVAGGPPCQGFSFAGKRNGSDPRNRMFEQYVRFIKLVRPRFLLLENVPGMGVAHRDGRGIHRKTYYEKLIEELDMIGYEARGAVLDAAEFGVPQRRERLVVIGVRREGVNSLLAAAETTYASELIDHLFTQAQDEGKRQVNELGGRVSAFAAISDLEVGEDLLRGTVEYPGRDSRVGYRQVKYRGPRTKYQMLMHEGHVSADMDSMRLAKHTEDVRVRFATILAGTEGRRGKNISPEFRASLNMLKHRTVPMDSLAPAPTLTTLPDDILHYSEPRILTVREYARLQSFPDWFQFRGKYTTGGVRRKVESPRYTQVGNAVPPLLSRALGVSLMRVLYSEAKLTRAGSPQSMSRQSAERACSGT